MDKLNKQELRRLAGEASHGQWLHATEQGEIGSVECDGAVIVQVQQMKRGDNAQRNANAAFIAAANPAAILSLLDEIESLRDLLAEKVIDSTALTEFVANNGGAHLGMEGGACALFAHVFGQQLYESNAINYIEATFESTQHPDLGQITVTLKRESGKTPHQLRLQAQAELEQYRKDAERYRWLCASAWYVGPEPRGDIEAVSWHDHNDTREGVTLAIDAAMAKEGGANG